MTGNISPQGSSGHRVVLAAAAVLGAVGVVQLPGDILTALLVIAAVVAAAGAAVFILLVRRDGGLYLVRRPAMPSQAETSQRMVRQTPRAARTVRAATARREIEAPEPVLEGVVIRTRRKHRL